MKFSTSLVALLFVFSLFALAPRASAAAVQNGTTAPQGTTVQNGTTNSGTGQNVTLINPLGAGTDINKLIADILQLVVRLGSVVVILMLVYIGFLFVAAQGNESKLTQAKQALMWTVIGALVLLGAEAIAQGIQATVNALSSGG